ncbi:MAG: glycosyltransferase family 4 protein, partial [Candidatus Tectomicrobia bacterium]
NIQFNLLNDKVIAVSNAVRKVYSANPQDTFYETVYAPFDHTLFKSCYFGFQHTKVTLGTVGSLVGQKGLFYLLHAMKNLRQYRHDIYLKVIGDGPLKSELEAFCSRYHLEPYVGLFGHLPHDANLYKDIDLYIQPSVSEGCSITLLEAMGTGIPVIASNIDGPRELIIPHQTGLLVTPKNVEALTDAIVELIENKEKAFRLGRAGQKRAAENFSAVHFIGKMSRIYQELCRHEA